MNSDCEACRELWLEYAAATHEYIQLNNKLQLAGLQHDSGAIRQLAAQVEKASLERARLKEGMAAHEERCHHTEAACSRDSHREAELELF